MIEIVDGLLLCPFCGDDATHIDEISSGWRSQEDGDVHTATFSAISGTLVEGPDTKLNYSSRRHWFEIHVDCEQCEGGNIIMAQHKGGTEIQLIPNRITSVRQLTTRAGN